MSPDRFFPPRPDSRPTIVDTEMTMTDQERGKEFEYRVIAINKSGDGVPGNTVMAVL